MPWPKRSIGLNLCVPRATSRIKAWATSVLRIKHSTEATRGSVVPG